jgi:hypothetical protein
VAFFARSLGKYLIANKDCVRLINNSRVTFRARD